MPNYRNNISNPEVVTGIVISIIPYGESHSIARILSKEQGKIPLFIGSGKNIKKNMTDLFDYGEFHVRIKNEGLSNLTHYSSISAFPNIRTDLNKLMIGSLIAESFDYLTPEHQPLKSDIFDSLMMGLKALNEAVTLKEMLRVAHISLATLVQTSGFGLPENTFAPSLKNFLQVISTIEDQLQNHLKSFVMLKETILPQLAPDSH